MLKWFLDRSRRSAHTGATGGRVVLFNLRLVWHLTGA